MPEPTSVLTVEDVITTANLLRARPGDPIALGAHDAAEQASAAMERTQLIAAAGRAGLLAEGIVDHLCDGKVWTVVGFIRHSSQVQHTDEQATPLPREVDERDAGRQGESRSAVRW
jgi:hypothetical protein